ncbi:MAG: hypothetical protein V3S72_00070, partial [Desulfobacterales bacterium]
RYNGGIGFLLDTLALLHYIFFIWVFSFLYVIKTTSGCRLFFIRDFHGVFGIHTSKSEKANKGIDYEESTICCFELAYSEPDSHGG